MAHNLVKTSVASGGFDRHSTIIVFKTVYILTSVPIWRECARFILSVAEYTASSLKLIGEGSTFFSN
jgi:hypothetical protein